MFNVVSPFWFGLYLSEPSEAVGTVFLSDCAGKQGFPFVFDLSRRRKAQKSGKDPSPFGSRRDPDGGKFVAADGEFRKGGRAPGRREGAEGGSRRGGRYAESP